MPQYILLNKTGSRGNTVITFATPVNSPHEGGICQEMDVIRATLLLREHIVYKSFANYWRIEWLYHQYDEFSWMPCPLLETPDLVKWLNGQ